MCESVQTRSLQLPLVSSVSPPIRGHLEQDTLPPLTRTSSPWSRRYRDLSYFLVTVGDRSDKGWSGRSQLPGRPPPLHGGRPPRSAAARCAARPPATAGTNRRVAGPLGGGNFWERGGVRGGRAGRRSRRRPGAADRAGRGATCVSGRVGRAALSCPPSPPPSTEPRRRAGTLNIGAD